jgi:hypothetical protein
MNIDDAISILQWLRATGAHKNENVLCVRIHKPGNVGGTACVPIKAMYNGIDWDSAKVLIELEREVTDLTPEQVAEMSKSAQAGQSWHSYQQYKAFRAEFDAMKAKLAAYDAAKENETRLTETTGRAAGIAHERVQPVTAGETAQQEAAKAGGGDGVLDLLQRRCDAYENTLEDIRDDSGYNKESGLQAADVLRRWSALPPPPEQK